jgi:hypothetical protein
MIPDGFFIFSPWNIVSPLVTLTLLIHRVMQRKILVCHLVCLRTLRSCIFICVIW